MTILSKGCTPDNLQSHNSLKVSFINIWGLHSNFTDCESFLESNSPSILAVIDKCRWLNWFWQFLCEGLSSFNPKWFYYSHACSHSLCKRRTFFCTGLISVTLQPLTYVFDWLYSLCLTSFSSNDPLFLSLCTVFDST